MERLTEHGRGGLTLTKAMRRMYQTDPERAQRMLIERLADYEDTEFEPHEILRASQAIFKACSGE